MPAGADAWVHPNYTFTESLKSEMAHRTRWVRRYGQKYTGSAAEPTPPVYMSWMSELPDFYVHQTKAMNMRQASHCLRQHNSATTRLDSWNPFPYPVSSQSNAQFSFVSTAQDAMKARVPGYIPTCPKTPRTNPSYPSTRRQDPGERGLLQRMRARDRQDRTAHGASGRHSRRTRRFREDSC
eukprot:TRINITY_DN7489_c0_g1_i14.p1 TRINITY_DN7489_c0_g1~~TRINITY_DN7489_c0_g1_i14.p1  ORF type:complete len:182 (+),score=0.52 TRINITY_DN7489_c0_g1_i14:208-753(+)